MIFHKINKNKIKRRVILFLTLNDFKNYNDNVVKQQYAINIIINVIDKNFFQKRF